MLHRQNPTKTTAWRKLQAHYDTQMHDASMVELFAEDADRFRRFSLRFEDMLVDFSKNLITAETLELLFDLAEACYLPESIERMFSGEHINETEDRAVLHVALRNTSGGRTEADKALQ